ncbi:hypothetical protein QTP86_020694, partial [Hemibagrus guttatus]
MAVVVNPGLDRSEWLPSPGVLQEVAVPIVSTSVCNKLLQPSQGPGSITKNMICAGLLEGGKDTCQVQKEPQIQYKGQSRLTHS